MSNDDVVFVLCVNANCRARYSTSLLNFSTQKNKCPLCDGYKAQRIDERDEEPPPFQEREA